MRKSTGVVTLSILKVRGGGVIQPASSKSPRLSLKTPIFFDFLKVFNEIEKTKKSETSSTEYKI